MKSKVTRDFWRLLSKLPPEIQRSSRKAYVLWREDPKRLGLHFKKLQGFSNVYSIRINESYSALRILEDGYFLWYWFCGTGLGIILNTTC